MSLIEMARRKFMGAGCGLGERTGERRCCAYAKSGPFLLARGTARRKPVRHNPSMTRTDGWASLDGQAWMGKSGWASLAKIHSSCQNPLQCNRPMRSAEPPSCRTKNSAEPESGFTHRRSALERRVCKLARKGFGNDCEKCFGADDRGRHFDRISLSTCNRQGGWEKRRKSSLSDLSAQRPC